MKKRILSIILTICMVIGLLPAAVLAEEIIIIKPIQDTDLGEDVGGTKILEYMEKQTATVPEDVVTPYGSSSEPLTLVEKEELYLTVPGTSTTIYTKNASEDGKRMEQPMSGVFKLQFTKSVAFDPTGSGKRNHIAILGFLPTNSSTANGAAHLVIMNADTNTIVKDFELDKDWFGWIGDLTTATANNFFAITAGDYNGDGRDSIVVYCTTFRGSGTSALKEFSYDGKNWNGPTLINVMRSDQEYYFNKQYMKAELYKSYNLAHKLGVALWARRMYRSATSTATGKTRSSLRALTRRARPPSRPRCKRAICGILSTTAMVRQSNTEEPRMLPQSTRAATSIRTIASGRSSPWSASTLTVRATRIMCS